MKYLVQIHSWAFIQGHISENNCFLSLFLVGIYTLFLLAELPTNSQQIQQTPPSLCHVLHPVFFSHLNWALWNICSSITTPPGSISSINTPAQLFEDHYILARSHTAKSSGLYRIPQVRICGKNSSVLRVSFKSFLRTVTTGVHGWQCIFFSSITELLFPFFLHNLPEPKEVHFLLLSLCTQNFLYTKPLHFLVILSES